MAGFWTNTPDGHTVHINGDPNMSEETRLALCAVLDAVAQQYHDNCTHVNGDTIYTARWSHYIFVVRRCQACGEVVVRVMGEGKEGQVYLATLPTRVAPYASNKPSAGYAYYWHFYGLNHSTPPIAPAPEKRLDL